jgi:hypothetical protein
VQRLREALIRLWTDLLASNASWALIGGLAVSVRAEPRTTRDLDVALSVSGDPEAESPGAHEPARRRRSGGRGDRARRLHGGVLPGARREGESDGAGRMQGLT